MCNRLPGHIRCSRDDEESNPPILGLWKVAAEYENNENEYLSTRYWLWLWPQPPVRPFKVVFAWAAASLEESMIEVDEAAISELMPFARRYWG